MNSGLENQLYLRIEREKCWIFNGYPQDDLRIRSGQITASAAIFGNSWKVCITINVLKFSTLVACQTRPRQMGQTQSRLLLKKQSDLGLPCLLISDIQS